MERLLSRKVLAIVGPGGVGKTTSAAALGILAARHGKRVLVLTVDPAKRLADALGVGEMMSEPTPIDLPEEFSGQLSAMMLDPKRTFDGVVQEYATDSEMKPASSTIHFTSMPANLSPVVRNIWPWRNSSRSRREGNMT